VASARAYHNWAKITAVDFFMVQTLRVDHMKILWSKFNHSICNISLTGLAYSKSKFTLRIFNEFGLANLKM